MKFLVLLATFLLCCFIIYISFYVLYVILIYLCKIIYPWNKLRIKKYKTESQQKQYRIQKKLFGIFWINALYSNKILFFYNKEEAKDFIRNRKIL